jgi:hypothetical protein
MLWFQGDGNLVLYNPSSQAIWSTGTSGVTPSLLYFDYYSNLMLFGANFSTGNTGQPQQVWCQCVGAGPSQLQLLPDGDLAMYSLLGNGQLLVWHTDTAGK